MDRADFILGRKFKIEQISSPMQYNSTDNTLVVHKVCRLRIPVEKIERDSFLLSEALPPFEVETPISFRFCHLEL